MGVFRQYLCLEALMGIYLGSWNATVPLIIIERGTLLELAAYEMALAVVAVVAMVGLAGRVETLRRSTVLKVACAVILVTAGLRYLAVSLSYSIEGLTLIDVVAVAAFGVIQSLFAVYPAETVGKAQIEQAFRTRRIVVTLSRVLGPLLAGGVIALASPPVALLVAAILSAVALAVAAALPGSAQRQPGATLTSKGRLRHLLLGIKLKWVLPPERFLTFSGFLLSLAVTATVPMLVPKQIQAHALAEGSVGLFNALFAAGAVAGLFFVSPRVARGQHPRRHYLALWALLTVSLCACALSVEIWQLAACLFVAGAASAVLSLVGLDKRTVSVPPGVRIRLTSATLVATQLANSAAYLLMGVVASRWDAVGLVSVYVTVFVVMLLYALRSRPIWGFLRRTAIAERYYPEHYPHLASLMRA